MKPLLILSLAVAFGPADAVANFSTGAEQARRFGVHEVVLTGLAGSGNPFDLVATVKFTPPSGPATAVTVQAFHDGGSTWRARVYVTETGRWLWTSSCPMDRALDGKSGTFTAAGSTLRGMLRKHTVNSRAWMTDDGRWFANISDTAYLLFHGSRAPMWREYVRDMEAKGITCMRVASLGGWGGTPGAEVDNNNFWVWNDPWPGGAAPDSSRFDLAKFQNSEERLKWMLRNHPDIYLQLILFSFKGYGTDGTGKWWSSLPQAVRERTMRYMIARWSAFPNLFWLIVNDMHCDGKFPNNQAFAREVGRFFAANDPWKHLIASGPNRHTGYPFSTRDDRQWSTYVHIEDSNAVAADEIREFGLENLPVHVWMAEDYYEQDYGRYTDACYFFRWLFWSWLLSGGSANYGSRWGVIHPYSQTSRMDLKWTGAGGIEYAGEQLKGLDSVPYIWPYFHERNIELADFQPDDALVTDLDGRIGLLRPKLTHRGNEEFLVYHPNAADNPLPPDVPERERRRAAGRYHTVDEKKTARIRLDLTSAPGVFEAEWYRAYDGASASGGTVSGGASRDLTAPWRGQDVVLRLVKKK